MSVVDGGKVVYFEAVAVVGDEEGSYDVGRGDAGGVNENESAGGGMPSR